MTGYINRFLALAFFACSAAAQEPLTVEAVAATYLSLDSYCDTGRQGWRDEPAGPFYDEYVFERCARRDGRFRLLERRRHGVTAKWSDGTKYYRYLDHGGRYQELALDDASLYRHYRNRPENFPVFVFEPLSADVYQVGDAAARTRYFRSYRLNAALSTPEHSVFVRDDPYGSTAERLYVANVSRSITRHETVRKEGVVRYTEITTRQPNRPVSDDELRYSVPIWHRYSLMNNQPVFIAGLFVASALAGLIAWSFMRDDIAARRRRLWRMQFWFFSVVALLLVVLALTSPGGGHPPAIVYVYVLGAWAAIAFGMTALFTLASYVVQVALRR